MYVGGLGVFYINYYILLVTKLQERVSGHLILSIAVMIVLPQVVFLEKLHNEREPWTNPKTDFEKVYATTRDQPNRTWTAHLI